MDISKFTESKTGQLIPVHVPDEDHAFVPNPLPATWEFDPTLWPKLVEARSALSLLDGTARNLPNPSLLLNPLQRSEAIASSRLEGTYATPQELMLFQLDPKEPEGRNDEANDWQEVANYNYTLSLGYARLHELPFCLRLIKEMHKALLDGARGSERNPGEFRTHQYHVGATRRYLPPPVTEMSQALYRFEDYLNNPSDSLDPLVRCFIAHYQLEAIHPFSDGNGRIGRVLLALMTYKWCNLKMPWLYLSPFFDRYKNEYIDFMFRVSAEGGWTRWIDFCLQGVIEQATKAVETCSALKLIKDNMHDRVHDGFSPRTYLIIEGLFDTPFVRIVDLAKRFDVSYPTAKSDVTYLQGKQILEPVPGAKIATFFSPEIVRASFETH